MACPERLEVGDGAKLRGFEVAYQSFLDWLPGAWSGLGYQLNFTYVDNQGITNANLSTVSGGGTTQQDPLITFTDLPLADYSKTSYNIVAMYDRGKFSARLAYNYRDEAVFEFSEGRPSFIGSRSQLDAQVGFDINRNFALSLQAQNLMPKKSATKEYSVNEVALNSYALSERRFSVGLRAKF